MSVTISPSIDQGASHIFKSEFYRLAQQTKAMFVSSGVATFAPIKGKTHNMSRMGRVELVETNTRNTPKQYVDYNIDNRQYTTRRFTRSILIDNKYDVNDLLKDPTSNLMMELLAAKERVIDKVIVEIATGPVLTGSITGAMTSTSAAADGVLTIDATSGVGYSTIQKIRQNYINNDYAQSYKGSTIAITGKENTALRNEAEYINSDYITSLSSSDGMISNLEEFKLICFAGSENGGIQAQYPILTEGASTRTCVVMAPNSIEMAMEIETMNVIDSPDHVNSKDITIGFCIGGLRKEGAAVQLITTTL